MHPVEISAVAAGQAEDLLLAHAIDPPASGQRNAYYGLDVRGWAVGRRSPAESAVVRHPGAKVREGAVAGKRADVAERFPGPWSASSGFFLPIGALRLPRDF